MTLSPTDALDLARELATQFATRADEADRLGKLPAEDIRALRASDYPALSIPCAYGGSDLPLRTCVEAQLELAQGSGSTALVAAMQMQVFGNARLNRPWSEDLYERLCRIVVEEGALFNSVASEPEIGSPSRGQFFATTATKNDDGYCINGRKTWSTGGRHLTHLLVGATLDDQPASLLVEADRPGIEWVETWGDGLSMRAADNHDVYFRDTQVPAQNLLGQRPSPHKKAQPWAPMIFASVYLGIGLAARDAVVRYALERVPKALGKAIATLPKIQRMIGEVDMALMAAKALLLEVAEEEEHAPSPARRRQATRRRSRQRGHRQGHPHRWGRRRLACPAFGALLARHARRPHASAQWRRRARSGGQRRDRRNRARGAGRRCGHPHF